MGLLKFLFIAIIILWVIRILVRMIFPVMVRKAFGNMPGQGDYGQQEQQRSRRPEGSISIDYMPSKKTKKGNPDKLGGDFVDFEEVK